MADQRGLQGFKNTLSQILFLAVFIIVPNSFAQEADRDPQSLGSSKISDLVSAEASNFSLSQLSKLLHTEQTGRSELYSESGYYSDFDFVTDTRVRYYHPLAKSDNWGVESYIGASFQYQSSGAKEKLCDNSFTPSIGIKANLYKKLGLLLQAGVRNMTAEDYQGNRSQWDPKAVVAAEEFFQWDNPLLFNEAGFEVDYLPRLDSTPAMTVAAKQGLRFKPHSLVNLDTYAEVNHLESHSLNIGPTATEYRMGLRSQLEAKNWNIAANIYHPLNRKDSHGDLDGILAIEGQF